jgi:predicted AAA+ superfamily ATPase
MDDLIPRWIEFPNRRSLLLLGPRRSGKTTLLRNRYPSFTYVTLDDLDQLDWAAKDAKGFVASLSGPTIIDEIQRCPRLTIAVKHAIDEKQARFLMTGSSIIGLLDTGGDTLAGRIELRSLPTFCWGEETGAPTHNLFRQKVPLPQLREGARRLEKAIGFGQFPEVVTTTGDQARLAILKNYRDTYFIRDLMQLSNLANLEGLLALFHHLARSLGSHLEISSFARETGLSFVTARKYLNALHQAQLTFRLYGYQYGPAKRHLKAAKNYFADNGIITGLGTRISEGQALENFVIAELEKRRKLGYLECDQLYYYKSAGGREIDVVFQEKETVVAIEIKNSSRPGPRDLRNLREFSKTMAAPVKAFLFYTGTEYTEIDGIKLLPVAALWRGI